MEILYLTYANSQEHPLPYLQEEGDDVYRALRPRALERHYFLERDAYVTLRKIAESIALYKRQLSIFTFSGHAGQQTLFLDREEARAFGIAQLLGECRNLSLVLLNGCSTRGQVDLLLDKGVPAVIATSAPVGDSKAQRFATRLFQALADRNTLGEAVSLAAGEVQAMADVAFQRKLVLDDDETDPGIPADTPLWGLYYRNEAALAYKLPERMVPPSDFRPNHLLIDTLWEALPPKARAEVEAGIREKFSNNSLLSRSLNKALSVDFVIKKEAVLKHFPSPVSLQINKLCAKTEDRPEHSYHEPGPARLGKLDDTFQLLTETLAYALLAQIWMYQLENPDAGMPAGPSEEISHFLRAGREDRAVYDFRQLIRSVAAALEAEAVPREGFFIDEFPELRALFYEDEAFMTAYFFLQTLRRRLEEKSHIGDEEAAQLCLTAEEALAQILSKTGFISRYAVNTVRHIDVRKFPHLLVPTFRHDMVRLVDLSADMVEKTPVELEQPLDNRTVLLLKSYAGDSAGRLTLSLSPFIIDINAFANRIGDTSRIYFFYRYDRLTDTYRYREAKEPGGPQLQVGAEPPYDDLYEQWKAFEELLKNPVK